MLDIDSVSEETIIYYEPCVKTSLMYKSTIRGM